MVIVIVKKATIKQGIVVRRPKKGEKIVLLDGSEKALNDETLLIADHEKPLAIAGVMGGLNSSVTLLTRDILLESASSSSGESSTSISIWDVGIFLIEFFIRLETRQSEERQYSALLSSG